MYPRPSDTRYTGRRGTGHRDIPMGQGHDHKRNANPDDYLMATRSGYGRWRRGSLGHLRDEPRNVARWRERLRLDAGVPWGILEMNQSSGSPTLYKATTSDTPGIAPGVFCPGPSAFLPNGTRALPMIYDVHFKTCVGWAQNPQISCTYWRVKAGIQMLPGGLSAQASWGLLNEQPS